MIKKVCIRLGIFTFLIFILVGCSTQSGTKIQYKGSNWGNKIEGKYKLFNGTQTKQVHFNKGEIIKVRCNALVEKGKLYMALFDKSNNVVKEFKIGENKEEKVLIKKDGDYNFIVQGTNTKGNFKISWDK